MLESIGLVLTVAGAVVNYVNRSNKIDKAIDKAIGKRMDRFENHRRNDDVIDVEVIDVDEETD